MRILVIIVTILIALLTTALFVPFLYAMMLLGATPVAWLCLALILFMWVDAGVVIYLTKGDEW